MLLLHQSMFAVNCHELTEAALVTWHQQLGLPFSRSSARQGLPQVCDLLPNGRTQLALLSLVHGL